MIAQAIVPVRLEVNGQTVIVLVRMVPYGHFIPRGLWYLR